MIIFSLFLNGHTETSHDMNAHTIEQVIPSPLPTLHPMLRDEDDIEILPQLLKNADHKTVVTLKNLLKRPS